MGFLVNSFIEFPPAIASKLWESTNGGDTEALLGGDVIKAGQLFETGHTLIGKNPTKIIFNLKKSSTPTTATSCKLVDSSDVVKTDFGSIDTTALTTSYAPITFENENATATVADGDRIAVFYSGNARLQMEMNQSTVESNTTESYYVSSWTNRTNTNCKMEVWGFD